MTRLASLAKRGSSSDFDNQKAIGCSSSSCHLSLQNLCHCDIGDAGVIIQCPLWWHPHKTSLPQDFIYADFEQCFIVTAHLILIGCHLIPRLSFSIALSCSSISELLRVPSGGTFSIAVVLTALETWLSIINGHAVERRLGWSTPAALVAHLVLRLELVLLCLVRFSVVKLPCICAETECKNLVDAWSGLTRFGKVVSSCNTHHLNLPLTRYPLISHRCF